MYYIETRIKIKQSLNKIIYLIPYLIPFNIGDYFIVNHGIKFALIYK